MEFIAHPYPRCGRLATQELSTCRIISLADIYAARALIALGRYPVSDLHGCASYSLTGVTVIATRFSARVLTFTWPRVYPTI